MTLATALCVVSRSKAVLRELDLIEGGAIGIELRLRLEPVGQVVEPRRSLRGCDRIQRSGFDGNRACRCEARTKSTVAVRRSAGTFLDRLSEERSERCCDN